MTTLIFRNKNLQGIVKVTQKATTFRATFNEAVIAYENDTGKSYTQEVNLDKYYEHPNPTAFLVKDEGIYLMASAILNELPKDKSHICYAEGFEPHTPNSWEKCRNAVGGDNFVEAFAFTDQLQKGIMGGADIQIDISPEKFVVHLVIGK